MAMECLYYEKIKEMIDFRYYSNKITLFLLLFFDIYDQLVVKLIKFGFIDIIIESVCNYSIIELQPF